MTITELEDAIYAWLDSVKVNATQVTLMDENDPRPTGLYVSFKVTINRKVGDFESGMSDASGDQNVIVHNEPVINIQTFRSGALQELTGIENSLGKQTVLDALSADNVAFRRILSEAQNISTLLDDTIEERASMDIAVGTKTILVDTVGFIEDVELVPQGDLVIP